MNDTDINKTVAELDGWTCVNGTKSPPYWWSNEDGGMLDESELPPYLTSRDAIVPVIEKQSLQVRYDLVHHLFGLLHLQDPDCDGRTILPMILATPRQLCEALLRATNKWKD